MKNFYLTPKLFNVLKTYDRGQFVKDIVAGVIVAIIALPLSIALALASGVEPAAGIYTAIAAGFVVSLLGGSRIQIAGPTAAFATIVAGRGATQKMEGLIIATLMAGIILGQIKDFLGLQYQAGVRPVETIEKIEANINAISTFSLESLLVGLVSLAILIIYPRFEKKIPPSLIAVIIACLAVKFIPVLDNGVYTIGELYTIPKGLPKFTLTNIEITPSRILELLPNAITIAVLAAIESLLSCVVADGMVSSKHNPNAELVAQGAGNMVSVMFGGIPATGAIARTAANAKNGGRTPVAGMVHAIVLLLVLIFLMPLASLIPMPTIAAILFMVAYNMSEWKKFVKMIKTEKIGGILVLVVTFLLTVIFDLVVAIAVGIALAVIFNLINKLTKKNI